jgi:hypothetical protein
MDGPTETPTETSALFVDGIPVGVITGGVLGGPAAVALLEFFVYLSGDCDA